MNGQDQTYKLNFKINYKITKYPDASLMQSKIRIVFMANIVYNEKDYEQ